jgi:hypothetical protein
MKVSETERSVAWGVIREALQKTENCFLCRIENEVEQRYIDSYLNELVMEAKEREKLIKSRGFCNYHFHKMFFAASSPLSADGHGMALILKSVAETLLDDVIGQENIKLQQSKPRGLRLGRRTQPIVDLKLLEPVSNDVKCPACAHISDIIQTYIEEFLQEFTKDEEINKLYAKFGSLCIPHYTMTLYIATRELNEKLTPTIRKLIEKQIQTLRKVLADLSEYIEKQDYRFSSRERTETEKALVESLAKIVGKRGIERTSTRLLKKEARFLGGSSSDAKTT